MVTRAPTVQPFQAEAAYSRLGTAVQGAFEGPARGLATFQELSPKEPTAKDKLDELTLKEKQDEIEKADEKGKTFKKLRSETAAEYKLYNAKKLSASEMESNLRAIENAESKTELAQVVKNLVLTSQNNERIVAKTGGNVKTANVPAASLHVKDAYKDFNELNEKNMTEFTDKGMRKKLSEYIESVGVEKASQEGAMRHIFKGNPDQPIDKEFRQQVNDMFVGELDRFRAESERIAATKKESREDEKGRQKIALQNQTARELAQKKITQADATIEKITGRSYASLKGDAQFINPKELANLQASDSLKVQNAETEIKKQQALQEIIDQGDALGDLVTINRATRIYDDIIDGRFTTSDGRKYGPIMGYGEEPKEGGAPEESGKTELPAPKTPAPKTPAAGGIPKVNTQEEYDALPSGAQYMHPDGSIKRKK